MNANGDDNMFLFLKTIVSIKICAYTVYQCLYCSLKTSGFPMMGQPFEEAIGDDIATLHSAKRQNHKHKFIKSLN